MVGRMRRAQQEEISSSDTFSSETCRARTFVATWKSTLDMTRGGRSGDVGLRFYDLSRDLLGLPFRFWQCGML